VAYILPLPSTFIKAIKNNHFITWLGLMAELINYHISKSIATAQRYLKLECQGLQLTKPKPFTKLEQAQIEEDYIPMSETPNIRTNKVYYAIINPIEISTVCVDLTGWFLKRSSRGNEYILVGYYFDSNFILG